MFQQRIDNSTDFYLGWDAYVEGFGDLGGNFWLGLDHLHALTRGNDTELYVYMDTFEGETFFAMYDHFYVGNAKSGYVLEVDGYYSGNAGNSMARHNGMKFSTKDHDQDLGTPHSCATAFKGAWWYQNCHDSNMNGQYLGGPHLTYADGINWREAKGYYYSMKTTVMKVRRKIDAQPPPVGLM